MDKNEVSVWVGQELVRQGQAQAGEFLLLALLVVDDSGSIEEAGNTEAVIEGCNGFLEPLRSAPGEVLVKTMFLNNRREIPFLPPKEVPLLTRQTYRPRSCTPLYLRSVDGLSSVETETQRLSQQGINAKSMSFIFTDGADNASMTIRSDDVKSIVERMLATNNHLVGGCAVNNGHTDFMQVFASMGIPEHWIRVLRNEPGAVRDSMVQMGSMAAESSANLGSYEQSSETGFNRGETQ